MSAVATFETVADRIAEIRRTLAPQVSTVAADVARAIHADLVRVTPVDTSNARSNWQVSLDAPITVAIPPYVPGTLGSTRAASAQEAVDQGLGVIRGRQPGQTIWISNNVPYIQRLNQGWSKQTPAGFVDRALLLARLVIAKAKVL